MRLLLTIGLVPLLIPLIAPHLPIRAILLWHVRVAIPKPTGVLTILGQIRCRYCIERPQVRKPLAREPGDVLLDGLIRYLRGCMLDKL